jgi:hypothetical protein
MRRAPATWRPVGLLAAILFATSTAATIRVPRAQRIPGVAFSMRYIAVPNGSGPMAPMMEAQRADWKGVAVFASGRGRLDILEGAQGTLFGKDDYLLFDSLEFIIVHPAARTFVDVLHQPHAGRAPTSGVKTTFSNIVVSRDSLGGSETVDGLATHHYRITSAYTSLIDVRDMFPDFAGVEPHSIDSRIVTDYWFADAIDAAPIPFVRSADGRTAGRAMMLDLAERAGSGPQMQDLIDKLSAAGASLPAGKSLVKMTTVTRLSGAPSVSAGTDNSLAITGRRTAEIDAERLLLPAGFVETTLFDGDSLPVHITVAGSTTANDPGAKWRERPRKGP